MLLFGSWMYFSTLPAEVLASSLFHGERKVTEHAGGTRATQISSFSSGIFFAEPQFALKVLVRDLVTRQPLSGASVDVYVNHTLRTSAQTGEMGEVLLWVPYSPGLGLTLLGSMGGYVPSLLPWSTNKRPSE